MHLFYLQRVIHFYEVDDEQNSPTLFLISPKRSQDADAGAKINSQYYIEKALTPISENDIPELFPGDLVQ